VDTLRDVMDTYVHPYYNKKIAVSQSNISKKSSVAIIIVAIICILVTFSRFVMYYTLASAAIVLCWQSEIRTKQGKKRVRQAKNL
jgi:uncharacterized membrane protein YvbJ